MSTSPLFPSLIEALSSSINTKSEDIIRKYHGAGCPCCGKGIAKGVQLNIDWNPSSLGTLQQLAYQLTDGYNGWSSSGADYRAYYNLGATGTNAKNGELTFNVLGSTNTYAHPDTGTQQADTDGITDANYLDQVREAIKLIALTTGVTFTEVTTDDADIDFTDHFPYAYAQSFGGGLRSNSHVNIDPSGGYGNPSDGFNGYFYGTILHEIYHVMGLGHLGDYNGTVDFGTQAVYKNDSRNISIMSYVNPASNPFVTAPNYGGGGDSINSTGKPADYQAIDDLYSTFGFGSSKSFLGDTTYGYNTSITSGTSKVWNQFTSLIASAGFTIADGGGTDTIDLSGFSNSQKLDLRAFEKDSTTTYYSDINNTLNNLAIAAGTVIENGIGGSAADTITGNSAANSINGLGGNDTMSGGAGDDTYVVDSTSDVVTDSAGTDLIQASVSYTAAANVENLTLTGSGRHQRHRQHSCQHSHR